MLADRSSSISQARGWGGYGGVKVLILSCYVRKGYRGRRKRANPSGPGVSGQHGKLETPRYMHLFRYKPSHGFGTPLFPNPTMRLQGRQTLSGSRSMVQPHFARESPFAPERLNRLRSRSSFDLIFAQKPAYDDFCVSLSSKTLLLPALIAGAFKEVYFVSQFLLLI